MKHVRPFVWRDIPQVARLHRTVFPPDERTDSACLESHYAYFRRVFLDNPWRDARLPSLVYQEDDGRIVGFLGVVPRRMSVNGQSLQAAISSQLVAHPASQRARVAIELAGTFLEGPQELSIADEANDFARRIWEGLGGTTALLYSMHWTRMLRPARFALSLLRHRTGLAPLAAILDAPVRTIDSIAARIRHQDLSQASPPLSVDDRIDNIFLAWQPELAGRESLRVEYDDRTFNWLLERARRRRTACLQTAVFRSGPEVVGWYLYDLDTNGTATVLQIAARPACIHAVLDHLFYEAWRRNAVVVTGRIEPRFLQAFSDDGCVLHRRGPWMLVNAKRREFLGFFQNGGVFFSRFDGGWCLGANLSR